jgi:hypothetical protein
MPDKWLSEFGHQGKSQRKAEVPELSGGVIVSEEELAYLEQCLSNPTGPSPTILKGAALLQQLKQTRR